MQGNGAASGDALIAPGLALFPPSLLVKSVSDFALLTSGDSDPGLIWANVQSYCTPAMKCDPDYSVRTVWTWQAVLFVCYSMLALYLDKVLPDEMGVRYPPWFFLLPSFWGIKVTGLPLFCTRHSEAFFSAFSRNNAGENLRVGSSTTQDPDVIAEEQMLRARSMGREGGRFGESLADHDLDSAGRGRELIGGEEDPECCIEMRGLTKEFKRGFGRQPLRALDNVWLSARRGETLALLGPNGAGKTTAFNILLGLLPATSGSTIVRGRAVTSADDHSVARARQGDAGVCPQFDALWARLTPREHLRLFALMRGLGPAVARIEADRRLEEVGLAGGGQDALACGKHVSALSGGMRRRVSLAAALLGGPRVVFLDEPTTGMDPVCRRQVWDVIDAAKQDRVVVLTTHAMDEADALGDRVAILARGRLRCLGPPLRLKTRFGGGYRVRIRPTLSIIPNMAVIDTHEGASLHHSCGSLSEAALRNFVRKHVGGDKVGVCEPRAVGGGYLEFRVATGREDLLAQFFDAVDGLCIARSSATDALNHVDLVPERARGLPVLSSSPRPPPTVPTRPAAVDSVMSQTWPSVSNGNAEVESIHECIDELAQGKNKYSETLWRSLNCEGLTSNRVCDEWEDIQIAMPTLEDVFLQVVRDAEHEDVAVAATTAAGTSVASTQTQTVSSVNMNWINRIFAFIGSLMKCGSKDSPSHKIGARILVELYSGEEVEAIVGCSAITRSSMGTYHAIRWCLDPEGELAPAEIHVYRPVLEKFESEEVEASVLVDTICPEWAGAGDRIVVRGPDSLEHTVNVPNEVLPGQTFSVKVPVLVEIDEGADLEVFAGHAESVQNMPSVLVGAETLGGHCSGISGSTMRTEGRVSTIYAVSNNNGGVADLIPLSLSAPDGDVSSQMLTPSNRLGGLRRRLPRAHTLKQIVALGRKDAALRRAGWRSNLAALAGAGLAVGLLLVVQNLVETLLLSGPSYRCPYCGSAADGFGRVYCSGAASCCDFFFPGSSAAALQSKFGVDVVSECQATAAAGCGGGDPSCFRSQWATTDQLPFCPIPYASAQRDFHYLTAPSARSKSPVLVAGDDQNLVASVANKLFATPSLSEAADGLAAAAAQTADTLFALLAAPVLGCGDDGSSSLPGVGGTILSSEMASAICFLLMQGSDTGPCCADWSGHGGNNYSVEALLGGNYKGELRAGLHFWPTIKATQKTYEMSMQSSLVGSEERGRLNRDLAARWAADGVRFASGRGKTILSSMVSPLLSAIGASPELIKMAVDALATAGERLWCVPATQSPLATRALSSSFASGAAWSASELTGCANLEEGLTALALGLGADIVRVHPARNWSSTHGANGYMADGPGRLAQVCDFFTSRANPSQFLSAPCLCKFITFARVVVSLSSMPTGLLAGTYMRLPRPFSCPRCLRVSKAGCSSAAWTCSAPAAFTSDGVLDEGRDSLEGVWHPFVLPGLAFGTPSWPSLTAATESATDAEGASNWWGRAHVLTLDELVDPQPRRFTCEQRKACWRELGLATGNFSVLVKSCSALPTAARCYLQRLGNLTGVRVGCTSTNNASLFRSGAELDNRLYAGHYDRRAAAAAASQSRLPQVIEAAARPSGESIAAFDLRASKLFAGLTRAAVHFNDTSRLQAATVGGAVATAFAPMPSLVRLTAPVDTLLRAFLAVADDVITNATNRISGGLEQLNIGMVGLVEMPRGPSFLSLDLGSAMGPLFFTLVAYLPLPTMVATIAREREGGLRAHLRAMGLSDGAYWFAVHGFWAASLLAYLVVLLLASGLARLSSGYRIGLIANTFPGPLAAAAVALALNTAGLGMLIGSASSTARAGQVGATLGVLLSALVAWAALDLLSGNAFNDPSLHPAAKAALTAWPPWACYRMWAELSVYSGHEVSRGGGGMSWEDVVSPLDEGGGGFAAALVALTAEWPIFILAALALDRVERARLAGRSLGLPSPIRFLSRIFFNAHQVLSRLANRHCWRCAGVRSDSHQAAADQTELTAVTGFSSSPEGIQVGGNIRVVETVQDLADVCAEETRVERMTISSAANENTSMAIENKQPEDPIVVRGLWQRYDCGSVRTETAVAGVTFGVRRGEVLGLLGPNGAGKTSLIGVLTGRLRPSAGFAWVSGALVAKGNDESDDIRSPWWRSWWWASCQSVALFAEAARGELGVCPQDDALWGELSPRQHIAFYARLRGLRGVALEQEVDRALAGSGLAGRADESAESLSGGMRRRLSVATALVGRPSACLLDEPSTGVDPLSRLALWRCIRRAARRSAVLLTTHSMEEAERVCHRLGVLLHGRLRCIGPPSEILRHFGGYITLTVAPVRYFSRGVSSDVDVIQNEQGTAANSDGSVDFGADDSQSRNPSPIESDLSAALRALGPAATVVVEALSAANAAGGLSFFRNRGSGSWRLRLRRDHVRLADVFRAMSAAKAAGTVAEWGLASATLEEVFLDLAQGSVTP